MFRSPASCRSEISSPIPHGKILHHKSVAIFIERRSRDLVLQDSPQAVLGPFACPVGHTFGTSNIPPGLPIGGLGDPPPTLSAAHSNTPDTLPVSPIGHSHRPSWHSDRGGVFWIMVKLMLHRRHFYDSKKGYITRKSTACMGMLYASYEEGGLTMVLEFAWISWPA